MLELWWRWGENKKASKDQKEDTGVSWVSALHVVNQGSILSLWLCHPECILSISGTLYGPPSTTRKDLWTQSQE